MVVEKFEEILQGVQIHKHFPKGEIQPNATVTRKIDFSCTKMQTLEIRNSDSSVK
jgi:hypothetical protein